MKKLITIISVMAAFAAAFTSCKKEEIVGTADRDGLYLNKVELTLVKGNSEALVATVTPKGAADLVWSSANDAVATVDANGLVTAIGAGETTVTAVAGERNVKCTISVQSPVTVLTLDQTEVYIYKGETAQLSTTVGPDDINVPFKYTWTSSNPSVFTVTPDATDPSKAVVEGKMGGFGTVFVQAGDVTTSIPVTIDVDLEGLVIRGLPSGKVFKGDSFQLEVLKDPIDAIDVLSPVWSSSDETVMKVDQTGLVTVMGPGTATITVESNGFTASVEKTANVLTTVEFYPSALPYTIEDLTFNTTGSRYASYMYVQSNRTLTFTVPEGYKIVEINITTYSSSYYLYASANTGIYDQPTTTWTGESNEVVLTNTGSSTYVKKFKVTYKD